MCLPLFLFKDKKSKWESCRGLYNENESIETFFTFEIDLYIPAAMSHVISNVCQLFLLTVMSSRKMFKTARIFSRWWSIHRLLFRPRGRSILVILGAPFPLIQDNNNKQWTRIFIAIFFSRRQLDRIWQQLENVSNSLSLTI
jgi:hypothetical protein